MAFVEGAPMAAAPLRYRARTLGALTCFGSVPFDAADLALLTALAEQAAVAIENVRLFQQVRELSVTDPLTGLANRRQLEQHLGREFAAASRGRPLTAMMIDLNGFKEYNDRYGHLAGDDALRRLGRALAAETRAMNMAARFGGDEFFVLLADTDAAGAESFLERIRARFPGEDARDHELTLAFSAGITEYNPAMRAPDDLVAAADRALYLAKSLKPTAV